MSRLGVDISQGVGVELGERIATLLKRRGWSQNQLAERAGVDKGHLSKLIRGRYENPGTGTVGKIAAALGVELSDLTGETEPTPRLTVYPGVVWVPYVERGVHAGVDAWRESSSGRTPLSEEEARGHRVLYAGRVTGECMIPDVLPGATVIWDPEMRHPSDGQQVVVSVNGDLMVKLAYRDEDGGCILVSHDGQEVRPNGVVLEGVVVKITNDPRRGPRSLAEYRRDRENRHQGMS